MIDKGLGPHAHINGLMPRSNSMSPYTRAGQVRTRTQPVEQAWAWIKNGPLANYCAANLADLTEAAGRALERLRKQPELLTPSRDTPDLTGHEQQASRSTIGVKDQG
jgi:hypothetical protein